MNYQIPTTVPDYVSPQLRNELKKIEQELRASVEAIHRRLDNLEVLVRVQDAYQDDLK